MRVTVVFGSDLGSTRSIAAKIAYQCGGDFLDIKKAKVSDLEACDVLILGCPTYGIGELQCDWEENMALLRQANLQDKPVALFGMGDQVGFADSFADAVGILYDEVQQKGARVIGFTEAYDYEFAESKAFRNGQFVGLVLDHDNQPDKTDDRIAQWVAGLLP